MQDWQKEILGHNLSIQNNIEKSIINESDKKSLDIIKKAYKEGKVTEDILIKARNIVYK
jgi:hypothetical protein